MTRHAVTKFVCDAEVNDGVTALVPVGERPLGWFEFQGRDYCPAHTLETRIDGKVLQDVAAEGSIGATEAVSADPLPVRVFSDR